MGFHYLPIPELKFPELIFSISGFVFSGNLELFSNDKERSKFFHANLTGYFLGSILLQVRL